MKRLLLLSCALAAAAGAAQAADRKVFSYDSADPETRRFVGPGLTFEFEERFRRQRVRRVYSTRGQAHAELRKSGAREAFGGAALAQPVRDAVRGDLYEIEAAAEGQAMARALCPGSDRAFMVFGRLRREEDMRVDVVGRKAETGEAFHCATLSFEFKGEWALPANSALPKEERRRDRYY